MNHTGFKLVMAPYPEISSYEFPRRDTWGKMPRARARVQRRKHNSANNPGMLLPVDCAARRSRL